MKKSWIKSFIAIWGAVLVLCACAEDEIAQTDIFEEVTIENSISEEEKPEERPEEKPEEVADESGYADLNFPTGTLEEVGIRTECMDLVEEIITTDIANGFTSAQLAVIKDGKLVYDNAFGKTNSYNQDGTRKTDSPDVTVDTLYDIASITKMMSVNYSLQKLVTDGKISIDDHITDYFGQEFVDDTIFIDYEDGLGESLDEIKGWKSELTIRHLLMHRGGFPASPKYFNPTINAENFEYDPEVENVLFSSNKGDAAAEAKTIKQICRTPTMFEPGTKTLYSDVDYMILGVIVEKVSGMDLDSYIKETFLKPMGLRHITYNPLDNGFAADDCAATELNGNTRDGFLYFDGVRTNTIQGQVHDEMAYYCMGGMSGHAGLFANARELAILGTLMFDGTYNGMSYFSQEVIDEFTAPIASDIKKWGLGWWRQGDMERVKYFGTRSPENTIGHQGWTGTLLMIDRENNVVIAYLTNKINSPVTDINKNPNKFDGSDFTASTLGFVPDILYIGMDSDSDVSKELKECRESLGY